LPAAGGGSAPLSSPGTTGLSGCSACDEYTTTAGPDTVQLTYEEGGPITSNFKKWFCAGTTTVDTVDGSAYSFHFGPLECTTFSIVQNTAAGSFTLIGTGAATYAE
jgi:hypothetical protein